jgi:hypothetical protein
MIEQLKPPVELFESTGEEPPRSLFSYGLR